MAIISRLPHQLFQKWIDHMHTKLILLQDLTLKKKIEQIRNILENYPSPQKGTLLELYLCFLFNGNGWRARCVGGKNDLGADILLYFPSQLDRVQMVVQVKNHQQPLDASRTLNAVSTFEKLAMPFYACRNLKVVSTGGFTGSSYAYESIQTISLKDWTYIEELILAYDPTLERPKIPLLPHNEHTYARIQDFWVHEQRVCAIQATGTGKTFLILEAMIEFGVSNKVILAPYRHIFEQIKKNGGWASPNTTYLSYQGILGYSEEKMAKLKPDLIVLDEFHHMGSKSWGPKVNELLRLYPDAKVLGTTATPVRYLDNMKDMAKILFNNHKASELPLSEAIALGILPSPKYVCAIYNIEEELEKMEKTIQSKKYEDALKIRMQKKIEEFKINWESSKGMETILRKYITYERKFLVFCKNEIHLKEMDWQVKKWFLRSGITDRVESYVVTSKEKSSDKQLAEFVKNNNPDTVKLLFSIDKLSEGLHVKSVDGVILLRSTVSPNKFFQQIGRVFESGKENTPLILDLVNNFSNIYSHDFQGNLREAKKQVNRKRKELDLPEGAWDFIFLDETKDVVEYGREVQRKLDNPWEWMYEELLDYHRVNSHVDPTQMDFSHAKLKKWCMVQFQAYHRGLLEPDKEERLTSVGFFFESPDPDWDRMYIELLGSTEMANVDGKLNKRVYTTKMRDGELKFWCLEQRDCHRYGKLNTRKIRMLTDAGFVFRTEQDKTEVLCGILYLVQDGILTVSSFEPFGAYTIGEWMVDIRHKWEMGSLLGNMQDMLENAGYLAEPDGVDWFKVCDIIEQYRGKGVYDSIKIMFYLDDWIERQINLTTSEKLEKKKVDRLVEIEVLSAYQPNYILVGGPFTPSPGYQNEKPAEEKVESEDTQEAATNSGNTMEFEHAKEEPVYIKPEKDDEKRYETHQQQPEKQKNDVTNEEMFHKLSFTKITLLQKVAKLLRKLLRIS